MCTLMQLTLTASLFLMAGSVHAGTAIDESRRMSANGVVDLELTNAIIRITGTDSDEFRIVGELGDQVDEFELRDGDGNIRFREQWRRSNSRDWDWGARSSYGFRCWFNSDDDECNDSGRNFSRLEVQVPRGSVLRLNGTNGDVLVQDLTNNTNIDVVNAAVALVNLSGAVRAETVNGSLDAENLHGRVSLQTVNGDISDKGSTADRVDYQVVNGDITSNVVSDDVSAKSVNGEIELSLASVRDLHATSVGGRIEVSAALTGEANVEISTVSGRINLTVPAATSARFRINSSGRINNELSDDEPERGSRYRNSRNLNFSVNGGRADVDINSISGPVTLRGM